MSSSPLTPEDRARLESIRERERKGWRQDDRGFLLAIIDRLSTPVSPPPQPDRESLGRLCWDAWWAPLSAPGEVGDWSRLTEAKREQWCGAAEAVAREGWLTKSLRDPEFRRMYEAELAARAAEDKAEAAQEEGAPPAVDLWVEARRLTGEARRHASLGAGGQAPIWKALFCALASLVARDPAAAEHHLLAAQTAAQETELYWLDRRPGVLVRTDLGVTIDAALTAVRALPRGGQP